MTDLEQAITWAVEPMTQRGVAVLCSYCGTMRNALDEKPHRCPTVQIEMAESWDARKRARQYAIE